MLNITAYFLRERSSWLPPALAMLIAISGLVLYGFSKVILFRLLNWNTDFILPVWALATLVSGLCIRVRYDKFPAMFTFLSRTTAAGILVYLLFEPPNFTLANVENAHLAAYVEWGYWISVVFAALSFSRPSFLYPAGFYVLLSRLVIDDISGFRMSTLDIRFMMEMGQFLAISACGMALIRVCVERQWLRGCFARVASVDLRVLAHCLAFAAIGIHLGNYFWSGIAKLVLGPHLWSWTLENQGQNIMLGALKRGVLPSAALPDVSQWLFNGLRDFAQISNFLVVATQLLAIVAVLRVAWLRFISYAYDMLHVAIYVFGGLFFWPWVWNNLSILLAVRATSDRDIGNAPKLCGVIAILMGATPLIGSAKLAWWDVTNFKIPVVEARYEGGDWVEVPVSFFLSHSYSVSHGYLDNVRTPGHYLPTIWGATFDYERQLVSGTCPEPTKIDNPENHADRARRLNRVRLFLESHHRKMVNLADSRGRYNYYLRSHHHPSNPWMHDEFDEMDIRKIDEYRLVTQSVCLSLSGGKLVERIIKEESVVFPVDK